MIKKRIKSLIILLLLVVNIIWNAPCIVYGENDTNYENEKVNETEKIDENELYAKSALLMDADSKRVLYQKNGFEMRAMASTTKIMTCLVALENSNPDDVVEFSDYAASRPKVKLGARSGSKFYMKDMLYSLMLESHNDTAVAIAESIAGSTLEFANLMNERAKSIGAVNTNFVTPNGLDDPMHYSTAYDMALIAAEAIKNEKFLEIVNQKSHTFAEIEGKGSYGVYNKDAFLEMMDGAIGIKTGFTGNAGYCFVGALKRDNRTFITVVLASGWPPSKTYKWKDTVKLMKYGIDHYNYRVIFDGISEYKKIKVINGQNDSVKTFIKGNVSTLLSDCDTVEYVYELPPGEEINAPVKKNQVIGKLHIMINGEEFQSLDICTRESVKKIDMKYSLMVILKKFLLE